MRNATSSGGSETDFDYRKAVEKREDRFTLKGLYINRWLNRPLASILVRLLFPTRVSPNQVTFAAFLIGLAGAGVFCVGRPWAFAAGGALAQLSSIVDCADGMLARARGQSSEYGAALDLLFDRVNEFFLLTAAAWGWFVYSRRLLPLVLGLIGAALFFLQTTLYYLTKNFQKDTRKGEVAENRSWMIFAFFVFGLLNHIDWGIYTLVALTGATNVFLVLNFLRLRNAADGRG